MDNTNHDSIVKMFYMVQLTEPILEARGNEKAKKAIKELKAAIITYLYSCKMVEESEQASEQMAWAVKLLKCMHILEDKINAFNEASKDWKG